MFDDICMSPECGVATAAADFQPSPEVLRKRPELELFCLKHFKVLMAARAERAAIEKAACRYVDGCETGKIAGLYPSGQWCEDHVPQQLPMDTGLRRVVDVELPESDQAHRAENEKNQDPLLGVIRSGAVSTEALLYSTEMTDDDPRITSSIKSALKSAKSHGWNTKVTVAISSEEMFSMLFKASHHSGKSLTTRHEQPIGKPLGFKVAWFQKTPLGLPYKIGWREAMSVLKGEDPTDDRPALIEAMQTVMDFGGEIVRVEVTA